MVLFIVYLVCRMFLFLFICYFLCVRCDFVIGHQAVELARKRTENLSVEFNYHHHHHHHHHLLYAGYSHLYTC
jgi:hypothetical protein